VEVEMRRALSFGLTLVACASAGCGGGTSPTPASAPRSLAGQPLVPCAIGTASGLCATLSVPEDRSQPSGRRIGLKVALLPATQAAVAEPLFLLAGGPGAAATTQLAALATTLGRVRQHRDIVLVDQRGTGDSNRLVVPEAPRWPELPSDEAGARYQSWLRDALRQLPGDVRLYTTSVAADDLDAVREALDYEAIDVYGGSYGATAAQYYLRQHPGRVHAAVLDGATLVQVPLFERTAANAQRALDLLLARCLADARCAAAYPDVRDEFETVLQRLRSAPVETAIVDPRTGRNVVVELDDFAAAAHLLLLDAEGAAQLPYYVHQAFLERWDQVVPAALASQSQAFDNSRLAMALVIGCSEAWARYDPEETARQGEGSFEVELQAAGARARAVTCEAVPRGVVPANDAAPVQSSVPVLMLVGEADPQDPPGHVADASRHLPDSLAVVVPGHGHGVAHRGCLPDVIAAFLDAGTTRGLDASCATSGGVPLAPFLVK
jgi:pimeloyl-ACP methyl ester carboxylesterase